METVHTYDSIKLQIERRKKGEKLTCSWYNYLVLRMYYRNELDHHGANTWNVFYNSGIRTFHHHLMSIFSSKIKDL